MGKRAPLFRKRHSYISMHQRKDRRNLLWEKECGEIKIEKTQGRSNDGIYIGIWYIAFYTLIRIAPIR